jgi:acyl-CoA thioester hydrolase
MTGPRPGTGEGDPAVRSPVPRATVPYRARFDECGPDGIVRTSALLRYVQDVAWIHSESLGFGREWYAERSLAWVVRAIELAVLAPPSLGQTIELTTSVTGFRRVWSRRRTEGHLADGTPALWCHTDWVMTDTVRGMPGRVPEEFPRVFAIAPVSFEPGRVPLPPAPRDAVALRTFVRPQDLDPMGHVNNAAYVDYLEEALAVAGEPAAAAISGTPRRVRIEYLAPASPGEALVAGTWPEDLDGTAGWAWRLTGGDGRELARARVLAGA